MGVLLDRRGVRPRAHVERDRRNARHDSTRFIDIALVNNMPDSAMKATEQQFMALLESVAGPANIRLHCFSLATVARSDLSLARIDKLYAPIEDLKYMAIDGMIVTGAEPRTDSLADEQYWSAFTDLVGWARDHTRSTIWSCLAAHAAVLCLDGIERRRLPAKRSGVYPCEPQRNHWLIADAGLPLQVSHSRLNEVDGSRLEEKGYEIITTSSEAGADIFAKTVGSEFVFFQGHPEYDAQSLQREYQRDIGRYLSGLQATYPVMPSHYFDDATVAELRAFELQALALREATLLAKLPAMTVREDIREGTRSTAEALFANWIAHLAALRD